MGWIRALFLSTVVLQVYQSREVNGRSIPRPVCRARVDLAFVIDGSGSIEHYGKGNFRRCLNFVRAIVSRFNFRGRQTRVGVVLFSSRPRLIFDFRRYRSKGQILNAISRIRYPRGGTKTGYAMRYCYSRVFRYARRGVRKVAIVMTDGRSYDSVVSPANLFRRANIKCYAVGIGRKYNSRQLLQIAAGRRSHVITAGFRQLGSIVGTIQRRACRGTRPIRPPVRPGTGACRAQVDLAFVIDGSGSIEQYGKGNFRRCLNFVRAIVSRFNFRGGQTRVGVVLYSSRPRLIFDFRRYRSKGQILNAISRIRYPRGGTKTGYAMRYCYSRVFRYARRGVRKVAIVMTDGRSYDSVVSPANLFQRANIKCYAVGIGRKYNSRQLLQIAAGRRSHVITAGFRQLGSIVGTIQRRACKGTRPVRPPVRPPRGACRARVDLAFVIDGSGSIEQYGRGNFRRCLNFVRAIVSRFNFRGGQTRVGVVLYSSRPRLIFDFRRYRSKGQILNAISRIRYPRGGTKTGYAMRYCYSRVFRYARRGVRKVAIVMTDGRSYDSVMSPANLFRRANIKCYAVGIGRKYNSRQLLQIAAGRRSHVITAGFRQLGSIVGTIQRRACRGTRPVRPPVRPPRGACRARVDLAFVIDGSGSIEHYGKGNFRRCLNFVRAIVSRFNFRGGQTRVGVVLFSSRPRLIFDFRRYRSKGQILNAISRIRYPRGGTKTGYAMRYCYSRVFRYARRGVRKVAIVMTDGRSYDSVVSPANLFRRANIKCYAVGIGRKYNSRQLLQIAAGRRSHVITAGFRQLGSIVGTIQRRACKGTRPVRPPVRPPRGACRARVDLAFVIDGSGSIEQYGRGNFRRCLNFVRAIVSRFNFRGGQTRVGVVLYSSRPRLIFDFRRYRSKGQILNAISRIRYPRGGTKTGYAMRYCYSRVFRYARRGVRKVAIVMTDGRSYDSVVSPANLFRRANIKCYAVGIGRKYNSRQLLQIAAGRRSHVITAGFRQLGSIVGTIQRRACRGTRPVRPPVRPPRGACRARVDLAFVIDGSGSIEHYGKGNFRRCLNFVRAIVSRFNFRGGQTRVGVVLYSSRPRLIFDFRLYRSKGQILNAISRIRYPRGGTKTGYAMRYCYSRVFRYARRGVRKVAIVMTDGRSYDSVVSPANLFRRANIKCYAVGIGRKYNSRQLLQIAAGRRSHVITAGFRQLGSIVGTIQRRACRGTRPVRPPVRPPRGACRARVDLAFVIDGSGSIEQYGKGNFRRCLNFVRAIVSRFNFRGGQTRVGVVLYSSRPRLIFDFRRYRSKGQILNAISRIRYPRGGTKTGYAMRYCYSRVFRYARRGVRKVAIVMTDGRSYDSVVSPANLFRRANIKCYAVGIGRKYNSRQLLQIAAGRRSHVITAGFRQLGSIVGTIQRRACRGTRPVRPPRGGRGICNLPKVTGPCRAAKRRWYYNRATGRCQMFIYGGCRGNANNFRSKAECERKCLRRRRVIRITANVIAISKGCFRDTGRRAVATLEGRSRLLKGSYRRRRYAIQKCAMAAKRRGWGVFAVQHGGWCASAKYAYRTYGKYGRSNRCRHGKGGPWANDVYFLKGSCRKRTTQNFCCVFPFIYRGKRYNSCTRIRSRRPWCAITPNYDADKLFGYCGGAGRPVRLTPPLRLQRIGCFKDTWRRAIPQLDGKSPMLRGNYKRRRKAIEKCAYEAVKRGYQFIGIQDGGWCASGPRAHKTFAKYGRSNRCRNGKGGPWANDVYRIIGKCRKRTTSGYCCVFPFTYGRRRYNRCAKTRSGRPWCPITPDYPRSKQWGYCRGYRAPPTKVTSGVVIRSRGCYRDTGRRAIPQMDGKGLLVRGFYRRRSDAIAKCALEAAKRRYRAFAVQHQGWCATGPRAHLTYRKYGRSNQCRNGKGGPWANDVYFVSGKCRRRATNHYCCAFPFIYKGRRYNSCTRRNHNRPWCALTPNYDRDKKWGNCKCRRRKPVRPVVPRVRGRVIRITVVLVAKGLGCFRDTGRRAISTLEGKSRLLKGNYRRRQYSIQKCALAAKRRGYTVFAIQHGGWCASARHAYRTYAKYGKSNRCRNGKGGPWANDVYVLRGSCRVRSTRGECCVFPFVYKGRKYTSCTTVNSRNRRPWCASTPNYDVDKLWGYCRGRGAPIIKVTPLVTLQRVGCFKDTSRRAIPYREGRSILLKGNYQKRRFAIKKCALDAARFGYKYIGVQHGGQCFSGPRAQFTYARYGRSNRCRNGKGGGWANDVYRISGKCRYRTTTGYCCSFPFVYRGRRYNSCAKNKRGQSWCYITPDYKRRRLWGYCRGGARPRPIRVTPNVLLKPAGCWRDTGRRAIPQMDGKDFLVRGYYRRRSDAIFKCFAAAARRGYRAFSVQHQGWCATGPRAHLTYRKYGRSNRCRNGKGGPWANDVYFIRGSCRKRTTSRYCCAFPFIYKGRRYNRCTSKNHKRPWCALTPNYDRDKKWGNCARRRPVRPVRPVVPSYRGKVIRITVGLKVKGLGCFRDTGRRAIAPLEGRSRLLKGNYRRRRYAIQKCALAAAKRGFRVFGVQHQGWCASTKYAYRTYGKYGRSNKCRNGKGGPWANDVYVLRGSPRVRTTKGNICVFPFIYRGKRYHRCTRVNSRRPWCALTPNYDVDKLYGWCRGRGRPIIISRTLRAQRIGCFKDTGRRAIPILEGKSRFLRGNYQRRRYAIKKCLLEAIKRGYKVFGVQHGGQCFSGPRAQYTYAKYGRSNRCRNGKGGPWANDVYRIYGRCRKRTTQGNCCVFPFKYRGRYYNSCARNRRGQRWCALTPDYSRNKLWGYCRGGSKPAPIRISGVIVRSIGCFKDTGRRAIPQMDGRGILVRGYYRKRADAIFKCALEAMKRSYRYFAVQHQGWCATGPRAHVTYRRYGRSNRCRNGKGGPWANDVYSITGSCRRRTTSRYCCAFPFIYRGRRYNSCTRRRHNRPWCALTPNYDRDKKWGNCARRRPIRPVRPIVPKGRRIRITTGLIAYGIGCFKDTGRRAIAPLEGRSRLLKGNYRRRRYAIQKCAAAAARRGYRVFAIQHGGWCASTKDAYRTYGRYGRSKRCKNGKGGPWANDVYVLRGSPRVRTTRNNICVFPFTYRGRRYSSCTRVNSRRPWCSLTPNYDVDKMYGWCRGGKALPIRVTPSITLQSVGCFKDTSRRAIPILEGKSLLLRGSYRARKFAIKKCALEAAKRGYNYIGVQHGGQCFSGPRARYTYAKYGRSNRCRNGKGGGWANNVYRVSGRCRYKTNTGFCCVPFTYRRRRYRGCARAKNGRTWCAITPDYNRNKLWGYCRGGKKPAPIRVTTRVIVKSLGCYKDTGRRAVPQMDGRNPLVTGYYRRRADAIKRCALVALRFGYRVFAVQHQGWCATGPRAHLTYRKYGPTNRCRNGKGGPWANDVYAIKGTCARRTTSRYCCSFPFIYKGRRYHRCTRRNHKRPWCATTPNYDRDKKWGNCAGRRPVKPVKPVIRPPKAKVIQVTVGLKAYGIGCYRDTGRRAIPTLERRSRLLKGNYRRRAGAIRNCALAAARRGYKVFAIQHGGWCASARYAYRTYRKYGKSNRCRNGKGGPWANDVYVLRGSCRVKSTNGYCCSFPFVYRGRRYTGCTRTNSRRPWCSLTGNYDKDKQYGWCPTRGARPVKITSSISIQRIGCFKDSPRRAIPILEGKSKLLQGNYKRRKIAIRKCAMVAVNRGYNTFSLQDGGQCFSGPRAQYTFAKYGRSNRCRGGKGGPWANDVYRLTGRCQRRTTSGKCCVLPFVYRGRRYNNCARSKRGRPWCPTASSVYKRNQPWGYCRGGKRQPIRVTVGVRVKPIGCFKDTGRRAIPGVDGRYPIVKGYYRKRKEAIKRCALVALRFGYRAFAVQHQGWCATGPRAHVTYGKYGRSNRCRNGKGGPWANDVYRVYGSCRRRTTSRYCCAFPFIYKGRRYNSCTRRNHNRPWCATTPNYDRDRQWGNCGGRRKPVKPVKPIVRPPRARVIKLTPGITAYSIGCYKDTRRRAIRPLEGRSRFLKGNYRKRRDAIRKCFQAAYRRGYKVFALQHQGWCASSRMAHITYRKYGKSNRCRNGKGGPWANDVYVVRGSCRTRTTRKNCCVFPFVYKGRRYSRCTRVNAARPWCATTSSYDADKMWGYCEGHGVSFIKITPSINIRRVGCFRDTSRRAIPQMDGRSVLLRGNYQRRPLAIRKCALVAAARGYKWFGIQHGGWCATGPHAGRTYAKYGRSNRCRNGKGGPWANDVYRIAGTCKYRTTKGNCCSFPFVYRGRRYKRPARARNGRRWCAITPDYRTNKLWGYCRGGRKSPPIRITPGVFVKSLGCFKDTGRRAIPGVDGRYPIVRGYYRRRADALKKCAAVAMRFGYRAFAVQHQGWCATGPRAHVTYGKYGRSNRCRNGKGGPWANDVYRVYGHCRKRTTSRYCCVFPFIYKGRRYHRCTRKNHNRPWCAITGHYDRDRKWGNCAGRRPVKPVRPVRPKGKTVRVTVNLVAKGIGCYRDTGRRAIPTLERRSRLLRGNYRRRRYAIKKCALAAYAKGHRVFAVQHGGWCASGRRAHLTYGRYGRSNRCRNGKGGPWANDVYVLRGSCRVRSSTGNCCVFPFIYKGRRYNRCTRVNSKRAWCASTPNYDHDKLFGYCGGRKPVRPIRITTSITLQRIGCYKDTWRRAIPIIEGRSPFLRGNYQRRKYAIRKCALVAIKRGYSYMGVQHGGQCASGRYVYKTYAKYGRSNRCRNGKGGAWANDVYRISGRCKQRTVTGNCCVFPFRYGGRIYRSCTTRGSRLRRAWCPTLPGYRKGQPWGYCRGYRVPPTRITSGVVIKPLGCFKDTARRAIPGVDGRYSLVKGYYRSRKAAIEKCALVALMLRAKVFAVQHQGWCATGRRAHVTYGRYGRSNRCRNGKGGPWANDVYRVYGSCGAKTTKRYCCSLPFIYKGRRYNSCTRKNHNRPWCALTSNYDRDRKWANCATRKPVRPVKPIIPPVRARVVQITIGLKAIPIGCFRDTGRRAIPTMEGRSRLLKGPYRRRRYSIQKCGVAAERRGYRVFAIQHQGWCASSKFAYRTYGRYGRSKRCRNGKGGPWANTVYILKGSARARTTRNNACVFPFVYKGRRYTSCSRVNSKRPWCAITPNYDVDKLWGYCRGRGVPAIKIAPFISIQRIGCFRDTSHRAIKPLDGKLLLVRGNYQRRKKAIAKCALAASRFGFRVFGVQHGGWCASDPRAFRTYAKYGRSNRCRNGKGGPWANDVYRISGKCRLRTTTGYCCVPFTYRRRRYRGCATNSRGQKWCAITPDFRTNKLWGYCRGGARPKPIKVTTGVRVKSRGCWRDTARRAIPGIDGKDILLRDYYRRRADAIDKCALVALRLGHVAFAVQHQGWCATSRRAHLTYRRYGRSNRCRNGKGGPWANDVYFIQGRCRKRTTSRYCCSFPFIYKGRRYNSCTKKNHNRPWCSLTGNYDRDKKWGNCAGRRPVRPVKPVRPIRPGTVVRITVGLGAKNIGCFRDTGRRAISPLEGRSRLLKGSYRRRKYAIRKCALAAQKRGFRVFAVQHGGWCAASRTGHLTYKRYGRSNRCRNGKGGPWANDVYVLRGSCRTRTTSQNCCVFPFIYRGRRYNRCSQVRSRGRPWCALTPNYDVDKLWGFCGGRGVRPIKVTPSVRIQRIGCYRDTARRAIPQMDGRSRLLRGNYKLRRNAIKLCALTAASQRYAVFGVQDGGWCASGPQAHRTFARYGKSNRCRNGKGGPWANDVYRVSGTCRHRTTRGHCCVFPFVYRGRRHYSCTRRGKTRPWCPITFGGYRRGTAWGYCRGKRSPPIRITTGVSAKAIGCFRDTSRRAVPQAEGRDSILDGYYRRRADAITKCALVAMRMGYSVFAVQHQGWCATGRRAQLTYRRYGRSNRCRNGKGGPWANDVYSVRGYCKKRTTSRHCCVFPFIYKGRRYNSCTRTRHSRRWCAITPNYDRDKKWGNCVRRIRPVRPKPVRPKLPGGSVSHVGVTADIAFLIDGSRYVGRRNFHLEKAFIKSIARRFTISKYQSHVGVATYGSRPHLRMRLNQYNSLGLVLRALNYIRFPNQVGRRVDLGLQASLRYFFARRQMFSFIRKVLVVVVSGKQTARSSYLISRLPSQFRRYGVKVFIIGVGYVDQRYLRPFTYGNRHVYMVRSYGSLVARAGTIAKAIHLEMRPERERYQDLQKRLNYEAGRNSTDVEGERYINGNGMEGNEEPYVNGTWMENNREQYINGTRVEDNSGQRNGTEFLKTL